MTKFIAIVSALAFSSITFAQAPAPVKPASAPVAKVAPAKKVAPKKNLGAKKPTAKAPAKAPVVTK